MKDQKTYYRTETRINPDLANKVKALVGYHGHRSVNDIITKALEEYIEKHKEKKR